MGHLVQIVLAGLVTLGKMNAKHNVININLSLESC